MMSFMRDEIGENVAYIEGKIAPNVGWRWGNASALIAAEFQQIQHTVAASLERWNEILGFHFVPIDRFRNREAVLFAERLEPPTPSIVDVTGNHLNRTTRGSRYFALPHFGGQMLDQKNCDPVVGVPGVEDCVSQV
jgi:hypothetical protein